jgi:hypothetical protein
MGGFRIALFAIVPLTSFACMALLLRSYFQTKRRILLWATLCFVAQTVANMLLFVDLIVLPDVDLRAIRHAIALAGMVFLVYAFITESH